MGRDAAPAIEEVLGGDHPAGQSCVRGEGAQGLIQPPFIRLLVLETLRPHLGEDRAEVRGEGLAVIRIADPEIPHPVPGRDQLVGQPTHPGEDCDDLLGVVHHVIRL